MPDDPYKYFRIEARELLEALTQGALDLGKGTPSKDQFGRLLRHAHTLKGAARIVRQPGISDLSHRIEDVLSPYREGQIPIPPERLNELFALIDAISAALKALDSPPEPPAAHAPQSAPTRPTADEPLDTVRLEIAEMDAFLYEVSQAAIHVSALRQEVATLDQALRLTGAIAEQSAAIRSLARNGSAAPATRLTSLTDQMRSTLGAMRRNLAAATDKAERELERVQERTGELRLLPARAIFALLERGARDAAESLGKRIEFIASGGENRLDAHVLRALRDALVHVVRNAVAHGIESEALRLAAGKPPAGRVELTVQRRGNRVIFLCQDDGRGIDVEQVRRSAIERGLASPTHAGNLDLQAAVQLLLRGGVSTTRSVTQVSGRGIGLDVVRETAARLKGEVTAFSEPGRGTRIELAVPISLEALSVLEVESAGSVVSLPFDSVVRTLRLRPQEIAESAEGDSILFDGHAVPLLPLAKLLRPQGPARLALGAFSAVVIQSGSSMAAVGVDRVLRKTNVIMRPLPTILAPLSLVAGASFDSEGNPQPVLDPLHLLRAVRQARGGNPAPPTESRPPVLVIDDSLTTRMLEQSILETAGYEVDLAVSGEDALVKARQRRYAMFVVDIEMPGIDGFEFIERVQADPQLRGIPAILVTSRSSPEDRLRGEKVGARAYIVKSEFDEGHLLRMIRSLACP